MNMQMRSVLIAPPFDGDPAMMAVIAGGRRQGTRQTPRHYDLRVYGSFQDRGRIDIAIDEDPLERLWVLSLGTPNARGSFLNEAQAGGLLTTRLSAVKPDTSHHDRLHLLKYRPAWLWYLFNIGVLEVPRSRLEAASYGTERIGYPAYLEASTYDSARLYERRGFFSLGPLHGIFSAPSAWSTPAPVPTEIVQRTS